jgi:hypothetical protein
MVCCGASFVLFLRPGMSGVVQQFCSSATQPARALTGSKRFAVGSLAICAPHSWGAARCMPRPGQVPCSDPNGAPPEINPIAESRGIAARRCARLTGQEIRVELPWLPCAVNA